MMIFFFYMDNAPFACMVNQHKHLTRPVAMESSLGSRLSTAAVNDRPPKWLDEYLTCWLPQVTVCL